MKAASFSRQRGCLDAEGMQARKITATSQRRDLAPATSGNRSNVKLQELKLAFCLLSREIQGLDEGGKGAPTALPTPAVSDGKPRCTAAKKKPPPDGTEPSVGTEGISQQKSLSTVSQQPHASVEMEKPEKCPEKGSAASCHQDRDNLRGERSGTCSPSRAHEGPGRNEEGRKAAEAAAAEAKEALKHLRVELDAERKSRIAAER